MVADSGAQAVQYGHRLKLCSVMQGAKAAGESLTKAFANFTTSMWGADFPSNCFYDTECLISDPSRCVLQGERGCAIVQHPHLVAVCCGQLATYIPFMALAEMLPDGVSANCTSCGLHPVEGVCQPVSNPLTVAHLHHSACRICHPHTGGQPELLR